LLLFYRDHENVKTYLIIFVFFYFKKISRQSFINGNNLVKHRSMSNEGNENLFDVKYKVLLLGDTLVGKTSLQRFIAGKDFRTDIGATIGKYMI
jgi:hypothetical protein